MRRSLYRIGIDIGGTFTDLIGIADDGTLTNIKVQTTPTDPAEGVLEALQEYLQNHKPSDLRLITHSTTVTTNALLGQLSLKLPRTALVTTRGFRDIVEIGRQRRPELYNLFFQRPRPLVPRRHRYEVTERIDHEGNELEAVRLDELDQVAKDLAAEQIESIAVGLINSYANPLHEEQVAHTLRNRLPHITVTESSKVVREYREYERISTTIVNAVLVPIVNSYLTQLRKAFSQLGTEAPLLVMQSNGGLASSEDVAWTPVTMVESGPASGVVASAFYSKGLGITNAISFDMGGTTAKAGVSLNGMPETVTEYEVGGSVHRGRTVKGSGYPVRFPFIDLAECSAGGGTLAWVDGAGALRVGPTSTGADPGPACYGRGNMSPTITDANLLLGRLNQAHLLGGRMPIYREKAFESIQAVCRPLNMDAAEAARGIVKITNSIMANIIRLVSVERGHDPRDFTLIAFGGAGPMHACALAEDLAIPEVVIPPNPGLFSAMGLLVSDVTHNYLRPIMKRSDGLALKLLEAAFEAMRTEALETLRQNGFGPDQMVFQQELDIRYVEQSYELMVTAPAVIDAASLDGVIQKFHQRHKDVYGYSIEDEPVEIVNARLRATGLVSKKTLPPRHLAGPTPKSAAVAELREVYFRDQGDLAMTPVYDREGLQPGNKVDGPAIVEQFDSTTVVHPQWTAVVDGFQNIRLHRKDNREAL